MKLRYLFFCSFFLIQLSRAGEDPPEQARIRQTTLSLEEATRTAIANNAALKAARAKWEMMKARVPQAAAWEDPMAGVDVERFGTTRVDTHTDREWMLSQKIPLAGKIAVAHGPLALCEKENMRSLSGRMRSSFLSPILLTENHPGAMEKPSNET